MNASDDVAAAAAQDTGSFPHHTIHTNVRVCGLAPRKLSSKLTAAK